jgi:hypothetical protein
MESTDDKDATSLAGLRKRSITTRLGSLSMTVDVHAHMHGPATTATLALSLSAASLP